MDQRKPSSPDVRKGVTRWFVREIMGTLFYIPLLFWPAGTWDWPMGWATVALILLWVVATAAVTIPRYPELLAERVGPRKGTKPWDMAILSIIGVLMIVMLLVAGFDKRYGWSTTIPLWMQIGGLALSAVGYGLVVWATASNAFFSQTVRIQTERGHAVADGGPYRIVRHPSYIGMILANLGTALLLGSWLAFLPSILTAVLFIVRTALEDATLRRELPGYEDFTRRTPFRLIPGIW